jgi:UDP-N-acetyl-D-glucosamine dehydrogenase
MERLLGLGAHVDYIDPFVPIVPKTREHATLAGREAIAPEAVGAGNFDAALIATDHDDVDYEALVANVPLVIDTRNATKSIREHRDRVVKA